jgi:hypothetical protein
MAKISIQVIDHKTNDCAGSGGTDFYVPITLTESPAFQTNADLKRGGFAVTFEGKRALATTNKRIAGFLDPQVIGSLNEVAPDFPVAGQIVGLMSTFVARVDVKKPAGTPVYLANDGTFDDVAGTVSTIVGYYKAYDPARTRGAEFVNGTDSKVVEFSTRFN